MTGSTLIQHLDDCHVSCVRALHEVHLRTAQHLAGQPVHDSPECGKSRVGGSFGQKMDGVGGGKEIERKKMFLCSLYELMTAAVPLSTRYFLPRDLSQQKANEAMEPCGLRAVYHVPRRPHTPPNRDRYPIYQGSLEVKDDGRKASGHSLDTSLWQLAY